MPQSMEIQYSRVNIKGDMSNFMKIVKISPQTIFVCRIQWSYLKLSRNVPFCSIWNVKRTFLAVKLLVYLLFGCHGNSYSYNLNPKWAHIGKHNFKIL